ncbi:MAG: hypothetical protein ABJC09_04575 [Terriglobia bacterium]
MKTPAPEANLTFATPDDSRFPYLLFFCVLGSVLAHAGTFFLFQVVYPQRVTIPQPAPHVSLLTPSSPENIALLRWIEAEDPALVANDNPVAPPGLVDVRYRPSFASARTAPLGAPVETAPAVRFPRAEDQLSPTSASRPTPGAPTPLPPHRTAISYSGALGSRSLSKNPPITSSYRASAPAEPTTLLIGVDGQGEVRFSLLQHSSGDPGLDELAAAHLKNVVFAAAEAPIAWGFATFSWGGDAYASAPKTP